MADPVLIRRGYAEGHRKGSQLVSLHAEVSTTHGGKDKVPAELRLCTEIYRVLTKHYPGHAWGVQVDAKQGLAGGRRINQINQTCK